MHFYSLSSVRLRISEEDGTTSKAVGMRPNRKLQPPRRRGYPPEHVCYVHPAV